MLERKYCAECGKAFIKKNYNHIYCCRRCFKISYRKVIKVSTYPYFVCPNCRTKTPLDFYPKFNLNKWREFSCPECKYQPAAVDY